MMPKNNNHIPLPLRLYTLLSYLLYPIIYRLRGIKKNMDKTQIRNLKGISQIQRSKNPIIWIYGSSIGEMMSIFPLIEKITTKYNTTHILLTTDTMTSASIAKQRKQERVIHQFMPMDHPKYIQSFLSYWRPSLVIFTESGIWFHVISQVKKRKIPFILVNARISSNSANRWKKIPKTAKFLMHQYDMIHAQDRIAYDRFKEFTDDNLYITGNFKFDVPPLKVDKDILYNLRQQIAQRPVWLAASTHPEEEIQIATTHLELNHIYPNILTIIIPRHPERGEEIAEILTQKGIIFKQRSKNHKITDEVGIYIVDTIGELGSFYTLSTISFMGGSLVPIGGHNPIEPAQLNCATIHGPHTHNFKAIFEIFEKNNATITVTDATSLANTVNLLLSNNTLRETIIQQAHTIITENKGALERSYDMIAPFLKNIPNA